MTTDLTPALEPGRFFLPGPTEVRPEVLDAQVEPLFGHRSDAARELVAAVERGLRPLFGTERSVLIGTMSATGFMEAAVRSGVRRKVLCIVNGAFSGRFAEICRACGRDVVVVDLPWGAAVDPGWVDDHLSQGGFDAVTVAHSETSTGALNPIAALGEVVGGYSDVLLLVDSVTGVGGAEMAADRWGLDMVLTGSQKALAMPPGLAFAVASTRLLERADTLPDRGFYLDLVRYARYAESNQTPTTPALTLLTAAKVQADRIRRETVATRWERHLRMAARCHAWVEEMRDERGAQVSILAPAGARSPTVTCVVLPEGRSGPEVVGAMRQKGFVIGAGYGKLKSRTIRIGHMGDHTIDELDELLAVLGGELEGPGGGGVGGA